MNILGIESSCDETAAAVVRDGRKVLSNVVVSSLKEHTKFGGIIPEIASRRQIEFINRVTEEALKKAKLKLKDIDKIAVTKSPGLIGSLLVGTSFAKALSFAIRKPLVEVNHIKAHLYANFLSHRRKKLPHLPALPAVGLVVSGGHTSLYDIKHFKNFRLLGSTLDDAAGEAFDKVARILGLEYPGGPAIDHLAKKEHNTDIRFKCAPLPNTFDFSFSGIKTAVLYYQNSHKVENDYSVAKVAYAFQKSVISLLVEKSIWACQKLKTKILLIGGGVAANSALRERLVTESEQKGINVFFPPLSYCVDNAAMIAGLGFHL